MMRTIFLLALGAFLMLLWQDPGTAFAQVENFYDTVKNNIVVIVQSLKNNTN